MTRRRVAVAGAIVLFLGVLALWRARRTHEPAASTEPSARPTWSLAELPSVAPTGEEPPAPDAAPAAATREAAGARPARAAVPAAAERERPAAPRRALPGALGVEPGPGPEDSPTEGSPGEGSPSESSPGEGSPLGRRLGATGADPQRIYQTLDSASPAELRTWLEEAQARARPEVRPFLSVPPDAPREQLLHVALLHQAIQLRDALTARFGARIPLDEAVVLAELNLAVAERGLNSAEAQQAIDADLARNLGKRPAPRELDREFASARAELDRVTAPGPPPEDPLALALAQASAYYRVMALAALRLELATGRRVPSLSPGLSPGRDGGMAGALEEEQ